MGLLSLGILRKSSSSFWSIQPEKDFYSLLITSAKLRRISWWIIKSWSLQEKVIALFCDIMAFKWKFFQFQFRQNWIPYLFLYLKLGLICFILENVVSNFNNTKTQNYLLFWKKRFIIRLPRCFSSERYRKYSINEYECFQVQSP